LALAAFLAVAVAVAVAVWQTPPPRVLAAATREAAFGLFPIEWILVNGLWIFRMTELSGHFDVVRRSFASVSDDRRVQGVVIAFSFGATLVGRDLWRLWLGSVRFDQSSDCRRNLSLWVKD
jgi:lactate permease